MPPETSASASTPSQSVSIAIIGGGPGGLMAAYRLQTRAAFPCAVTLFEASPHLGGKVLTGHFDTAPSIRYETGAAEFYDYSQLGPDPLRELIAELNLPTQPMAAGGAVFRNHLIRHPDDLARVFGPATGQALKKFEQQARALISPQDYYESDWRKDNNELISRQSFSALLATVPDEAARDYIRTMVHSDLACEPHHTNASYGLQNYLMDEPDYMQLYAITGGNARLVQTLAKRVTAQRRLRQPVTHVGRGPGKSYRVTSRVGGQTVVEHFDYVIVALPNDWIPAITWEGPALAAALEAHHQFYDHPAHYLRVTVLFDRPFWREHIGGSFFMHDAFGGCCLYDEGTRFEAHGQGVLAWLIAGEAALRLGNLPDSIITQQVLASLPAVLRPESAQVLESKIQRWAGTVNALPAGFPAREPDSRHQPEPAQHPGLFVMGDYLFDSTLNGVLDSADTVVEWIIEEATAAHAVQPLATVLAP